MVTITTPVTQMLRIERPILLAGMFGVSNHELAAAVSNAGGLGTIGGLTMTPEVMRKEIQLLKADLRDPTCFGIDLAWPQVGGAARKTNKDYTHGHLPELIDIMIEEGARMFVCAVGVPPKWAVDKLHAGGVTVMNMIGDPKHVAKALAMGVDLICAQGTEAGGHSGAIGTMALIPQCVDACKGRISPLHKTPVHVVAAGGIYDGRGVAAALSLGAQAVWVGTRFIAAEESSASGRHKRMLVGAKAGDTVQTLVYSGRPMRVHRTDYVMNWHNNRAADIDELCRKGVIPYKHDMKKAEAEGKPFSVAKTLYVLYGQAAGGIDDVLPAGKIVDDMMRDAIEILQGQATRIARL